MSEEVVEVPAAQPSVMDRFWLDTARSATKESIGALEDDAKQLISITSLIQGIYFAAISFGDLKMALVVHDWQGWLTVLLFASPIALWLVSLAFAVRVFTPEIYKTNLQSPDLAKGMLQQITAYKYKQLRWAHVALLLGFVLLVINIVLYLGWMPQSVASPSNLIN
jgi:p-aminobenzoyl-glutamate transporter AbgT